MSSQASFGDKLYSGERSFNFVGQWRRNLGLGVALCVMALVLLLTVKLNPGIEFRGGSEFRISGIANTSTAKALSTVKSTAPEAEEPKATVIGADSIRVQTGRLSETQTDKLKSELATAYGVAPDKVSASFVGPSWGADVTEKSLTGLGIFLVLVSLVIWLYFRTVSMAAAAMIALAHDLLITVGVYAATRFEVTPGSVIGFLTILGYSLYDTVVVFDKVRENTAKYDKQHDKTFVELANLGVNQSLVRSVNTSVVAILPVAAVLFIGAFMLGAGTLRDISMALFVGMLIGAFSSIFIAPPAFWLMRSVDPKIKAHTKEVLELRQQKQAEERAAEAAAAGLVTDAEPVGAKAARGHQRQQPHRKKK